MAQYFSDIVQNYQRALGVLQNGTQAVVSRYVAQTPTPAPCQTCPASKCLPADLYLSAMFTIMLTATAIICWHLSQPETVVQECPSCGQNALATHGSLEGIERRAARLDARCKAKQLQWERLERLVTSKAAAVHRAMDVGVNDAETDGMEKEWYDFVDIAAGDNDGNSD